MFPPGTTSQKLMLTHQLNVACWKMPNFYLTCPAINLYLQRDFPLPRLRPEGINHLEVPVFSHTWFHSRPLVQRHVLQTAVAVAHVTDGNFEDGFRGCCDNFFSDSRGCEAITREDGYHIVLDGRPTSEQQQAGA